MSYSLHLISWSTEPSWTLGEAFARPPFFPLLFSAAVFHSGLRSLPGQPQARLPRQETPPRPRGKELWPPGRAQEPQRLGGSKPGEEMEAGKVGQFRVWFAAAARVKSQGPPPCKVLRQDPSGQVRGWGSFSAWCWLTDATLRPCPCVAVLSWPIAVKRGSDKCSVWTGGVPSSHTFYNAGWES